METQSSTTESLLLSNSAAASAAARSSKNFWAAPLVRNGFANGPLKLTLSAYCRPENTVRLTDASLTKQIHTKYELLDPSRCRTLGHGASSTVRLAYRRSDGQPVAVKTIAKHDALGLWSKTNRWRIGARSSLSSPRDAAGEMRQQVKKRRAPRLDEVDVLTSLRGICPNVVQLLDVYETHQEVQLVLEYCEGGDLFDCIKRRKQMELELEESAGPELSIQGSFTELETSTVAKTLLDVLSVLHSKHIVHRDIKPENILLVDEDEMGDQLGPVKLTDFGLARLLHNESEASSSASDEDSSVKQRSRAYSRVGSDYYAAPEVHMGLGYDTPVDIYSLGVTLYVMLCGTPPSSTSNFRGDDLDLSDEDSTCVASLSEESTQSSHSSRSELFPSELNVSTLAQDLISKMIHPDPDMRITASEALKHEWITKHLCQEEAHSIAHVTSKLSLTCSSENLRPRTLSFAETESFLRIGPAIPVVPPSNSPIVKMEKRVNFGRIPEEWGTPTSPTSSPNAVISLTLADVCNKLAPLMNEQRLQKQRKHRHRSLSHGDKLCLKAPRKHSMNGGDEPSKKKKRASTSQKRVHLDLSNHPQLMGIGRGFNSPTPSFEPIFQTQSKSLA